MNLKFNHEDVLKHWYDTSLNLVNSAFYYYDKPINVDISTLVILKAEYDDVNYMSNQKNIWTIQDNITREVLFKVHNESVPYIFESDKNYDITVESYDYYGNLSKTK
jgi:hypothetical protein